MVVGVPKEIKPAERRVALTPAGAHQLVEQGVDVLIERDAGTGSGFDDVQYAQAGALVLDAAAEIWERADLILKVKEPIAAEYELLRDQQTLFTYLHLAADRPLTEALLQSGGLAIGYETVTDAHGGLPLLTPMSEIAGRLATQAGAYFLQSPLGGSGTLIGGAPGVAPAHVVIVGGGAVGKAAARVACGMGARVTVLERSPERIRELEEFFDGRATVLMSDPLTLDSLLPGADVLIGAVLIPGARAPRLVTRESLGLMRRGAVLVDVAIDQGGFAETSRPTTHAEPVYEVDGVVHYCVSNMPGAVPVTSTQALTNATLPYVLRLAGGVEDALASDAGLAAGVNVRAGEIVNPAVAVAFESSEVAVPA
ncbi:MAG TPA: alanine dehydrogenase [Solirubrobacteraceae bacterium]|nr:alanine dehydrogenase [Solirubrobacteraceae bacterium]